MAPETGIQSQVESYQRLKKWYLMLPCFALSIIRKVSRVKWSNPGKGAVLFPTLWCSSYRKGSLRVTLDYGCQLYFTFINILFKCQKRVPFETIQFSISTQFSSIWPIDRTLTGATTPVQSWPGSNGNEEILRIPQSSSITGTSLSGCLVSYTRTLVVGGRRSYPFAEKQSVYSTAPADWLAKRGTRGHSRNLCMALDLVV